jgi:uncharacterized protein (DUF58 family)
LDPILVVQLKNLELRARRILDGLYAGHHKQILKGHSQDFSEHRPYYPGDDPKNIDWKAYGKTDRLVIRQFDEQTNMSVCVFIDDSPSMNFASPGHVSKLDYAKTLASAIGYLVQQQHDAIGLMSSNLQLPSRNQEGHFQKYLECLTQLNSSSVWNLKKMSSDISLSLRKKSLVVVVSDLMGNRDEIVSTLKMLSIRKHEVLVVQVLDPAERELPYDGTVIFKDLETQEELKTDPAVIRNSYKAWVDGLIEYYQQVFRGNHMDYVFLTTDVSFDKGLGAYLTWREARL